MIALCASAYKINFMKHQENILVTPLTSFDSELQPYGITSLEFMSEYVDALPTQWLKRADMEENPNYKQLIPYVLVRRYNSDGFYEYLTYARAKGSGEGRLIGQRSLGFGGHVDEGEEGSTNTDYVLNAASRELFEEIGLESETKLTLYGLINNDRNPVGRVHVGILLVTEVDECWEPTQKEEGVASLEWLAISEIENTKADYEDWSKLIADYYLIF